MPKTLQDVATAAHVSLATVSRVLNNRQDVSPETVELVEGVMRQLGYQRSATRRGRPSSTAHSTSRTTKEKTITSIGLLVPGMRADALRSPLTGQLVEGAEAIARNEDIQFHLARLSPDGKLPPCLDPVQVDGLIVRSAVEGTVVSLPTLPTVWIFKVGYASLPGDVVQPDNEMIGEMAARYLVNHNHQNLAAIVTRSNHAEAQVRADRFVRLAKSLGANAVLLENRDIEAIADQLLGLSPSVTGIFMPLGDNLLEALYRALQRRGVRCGGAGAEVEFISCNNDTTLLRLLDSSLANIDIRAEEIGKVAVETLLWRIQNPNQYRRSILIEPQLIEPAA